MLEYLYCEIGTSPTENILICTLDFMYTYTYIWQDISYQYVSYGLYIFFISIYLNIYMHQCIYIYRIKYVYTYIVLLDGFLLAIWVLFTALQERAEMGRLLDNLQKQFRGMQEIGYR